jgi:hypothetical protein
MKGALEGRVMVLENIINRDIPAIREYMAKGVELRVENTKHLTEIKSACDASQKYQEECDIERLTLRNRVEKVEKKQTWASGIAAGIAGVISFIGWGLGYLKP